MFFDIRHGCLYGCLRWGENCVFSCFTFQNSKYMKLIGVFSYRQSARLVFFKISLIQIPVQCPKHHFLFHVVAINQRVIILELRVISAIQENTSCQCILSIWVFIQILCIIFSLHDRIIYFRSIQGQPCHHVSFYFFCRGIIIRFVSRFVF